MQEKIYFEKETQYYECMSFYLLVKTGPQAGLKFPLKEGFSIGRSRKSSLCLSDPSVSAIHAKVVKRENRWILVDNSSFNGTKFRGEKVHELLLSRSICFQIGKNTIEVLEEKTQEVFKPSSVTDFVDSNTTASFRLRSEEKSWQERVLESIEEGKLSFQNELKEIQVFNPSLCIQFISGLQVGTQWEIVYGPRKVGKKSLDLPIYDEKSPDFCFEICPSVKGPFLKTLDSKKDILINQKFFSSKKLEDGDQIEFGDTALRISFKKSPIEK